MFLRRIGQLRAALPQVRAQLAGHRDVTFLGVGEKRSAGCATGRNAIVIGVERKGGGSGAGLPPVLTLGDGAQVETDVIEASAAARRLCTDHVDGGDLLITADGVSFGTLGVVIVDRGGAHFAVTNAHVVADVGQDATGRAVDGIFADRQVTIGEVAHMTVLSASAPNVTDLALVKLNPMGVARARPYAIEAFGEPVKARAGLSAAGPGGAHQPHAYASAARGAMETVTATAPVEARGMTFEHKGATLTFARSFRLVAHGSGVAGGHSGALLVRSRPEGGLAACGLVFAGLGRDLHALSFTDVHRQIVAFGIDPK